MNKKNRTFLVACLLLLAVVLFLLGRRDGGAPGISDAELAEVTLWLCTDEACGHDFSLTVDELRKVSQKQRPGPPHCPKCGTDQTVNAAWTQATTTVPAGSNVTLRVQVSDGPGPGDLVEAGIDDFSICPSGSAQ